MRKAFNTRGVFFFTTEFHLKSTVLIISQEQHCQPYGSIRFVIGQGAFNILMYPVLIIFVVEYECSCEKSCLQLLW